MNRFVYRSLHLLIVLLSLVYCAGTLRAQTSETSVTGIVEGKVCDSQGSPLVAVTLALEDASTSRRFTSTTDTDGHFHFDSLPSATYRIHATLTGYNDASVGPFNLEPKQSRSFSLVLTKPSAANPANDTAKIEYSDEPQFTVAGVTDTTNLGGHGSATFVRNRDALSKEAASLAKGGEASSTGTVAETNPVQTEAGLRALLQQHETADLHAQLADLEESGGRPLDAVRDYQRAAEMDPSEPHLFAWGAELLLHHAYEPAIEVFGKGRRLHPRSVRMLLGLGAARYAQGTREEAVQTLMQACDLDPADPNPYLFVGRLQAIENIELPGWLEHAKRFVTLHPENAMAHYLYAVALSRHRQEGEQASAVESQLKAAVQFDPHLGSAYLKLGVLYAQRQEFPAAIAAFQKAIENTALADEAHYRLAQVYRATGNTEKAQQETQLFKQVTEQRKQQAERERHEIPQFVYTLRSPGGPSPGPSGPPR